MRPGNDPTDAVIERLPDLLEILRKEAARSGTSVEELTRELTRSAQRRAKHRRLLLRFTPLTSVVVLTLGILWASRGLTHHTTASTQTCGLNAYSGHSAVTDLISYCADQPAVADEVNHNFERSLDFLVQKTGPLTSDGITTDGNLTINSADFNFGKDYFGSGTIGGRAFTHSSGDTLKLNTDNDFFETYFGGTTVTVNGTFTATGTINMPSTFTTGTGSSSYAAHSDHYHDPTCPGTPTRTVAKNNSKLCVYRYDGTVDYGAAAYACWNSYEAQLCTTSELRIATADGLSLTTSRWLADRPADDTGVYVNGTGTTDFDGTSANTTSLGGAYCCRTLRRP
jgi:hypothetical protein